MAKGYLNIEVTPHRIRYILMQSSGRGYEVLKSGAVAHTLNTLVPGDLTRAIKEILVKENISPKRLFVSLCRQGTLIRQITMPRMKKQEIDEAISSEIEKLPFFANNLYDYIYTANRTAKEKLNVILSAIDQNTLNYVIEDCRKLRIPFEHLEITPLNIKDVIPYKKTDNPSQMVLIVHDQMSYLMMLYVKEYRFVYQSSTGMQHLCPSRNGHIVDAVFANFAGELQRVIKAYMSEHKLENNPKLWLIWDSESGSGLEQMIAERLGMECTILSFDHLNQFKFVKSPETANPIHTLYCVPMFIFLEKTKEQFALNHFFRAMNVQRYVLRSVILTLLFIAIVGSGLGIKAWEFYKNTNDLKMEIQQIASEHQQLMESSQDLYRQRDDYMRIRQGLLDQATFVKNLNRVSWSEVLAVVSEEMPKDLALTSFKFSDSGSVAFFGDALDVEVIAELIRRVDTSAILQNGKFDFLTEKVIEKTKIYNFGILAQLQNKASEEAGEIVPNNTQVQGQEQKPTGVDVKSNVPAVSKESDEKTNH